MSDNSSELVLVTGGTGFISCHTVKAFLEHGFRVRTTARSPENKEKCAALYRLKEQLDDPSRLEIVKCADLLEPECWITAAKGCTLCAHLASPFFFAKNKKDEAKLCEAAVNGTLNVLRACEQNGIKRVVVTSSMAAVSYGHPDLHGTTVEKPEEMWSVENKVDGYVLSKLLAERAAWKFVKEESKIGMQMSTVNPTFVVGPSLGGNWATSHELLSQFFGNKLPAVPDLNMNAVDVRDVAEVHVRVLEKGDEAMGKRFIAVGPGHTNMRQMAGDLQAEFGQYGYKFKQGKLPKWIMSVMSVFNKTYKNVLPNVGTQPPVFNTSLTETVLGVKYRETARTAHIEQAHAALAHGVKGFPRTAQYEEFLQSQAQAQAGGGAGKNDAEAAETAAPKTEEDTEAAPEGSTQDEAAGQDEPAADAETSAGAVETDAKPATEEGGEQ